MIIVATRRGNDTSWSIINGFVWIFKFVASFFTIIMSKIIYGTGH